MKDYFTCFYESGSLEEKAERYFTEKRNYEDDVKLYFSHIKTKPPKSVDVLLAVAKGFLMENGVELPQLFWHRLRGRKKGTRALTRDKVPSNLELRKILSHMPIQGRTLFLALSSSGMRIGEGLSLTPSDVDMNSDPVRITIRGENSKTGNGRLAFISGEAKEALEEWLRLRRDYLQGAVAKSKPRPQYKQTFRGKSLEDPRLFPFEWSTASMTWNTALAKAGFNQRDNGTNHYQIHPHVLRKFFRSKLGTVIPADIVEALMGHEEGLTEVYRRYSEEDLAKFYKQGEHALLVFSNGADVSKLREDFAQEKTHLQSFVDEFSKRIALENQELRVEVARLKLGYEQLKQLIEERLKTLPSNHA